jgi:hypothetical protein
MKLTIEKHPELTRLIDFFAEIELMAQRMGLHVDDLNHERKANTSHLHTYFRSHSKEILEYRTALLNNAAFPKGSSLPGQGSTLSIHKDE